MYVRSFSDHRLQYTSKLKIISREYVEYDITRGVIRTKKSAPEQKSAPGGKKALPGAKKSAPGST